MIKLNGRIYNLCLVDTNVVSEMLKNPQREFRLFCEWALSGSQSYIPCFSLFTIIELRRRPDIYEQFLEKFSIFPCIMLKGHEELVREEMDCYPDPSKVSVVSLRFGGVAQSPERRLDCVLNTLFAKPDIRTKESAWLAGRAEVIDDIYSLVQNYPPKSGTYSAGEIRSFLEIVCCQQIAMRSTSFVKTIMSSDQPVQIDAFPSLKMSLLTVFYKFYVDRRKPRISDAFDVIISAPTPYVDAVITENHQAEVIRKIKRIDPFLDKVTFRTLHDFRD